LIHICNSFEIFNFSLSGYCCHVAGLIYHIKDGIENEVACTSKPQEWHKPRGKKIIPEPVFNAIRNKQISWSNVVDNRFLSNLYQFKIVFSKM